MGIENLPIITAEKVSKLLDYKSLTKAVSDGFGIFSRGKGVTVDQPVRTVLNITQKQGCLACMPVYSQEQNILTTKILTFYPQNKGVPTHNALIVAFDPNQGVPKAIMDADVITAKRTAAASVAATQPLVNGEPETLAILGSGVQARSHIEAFSNFYKFKQINIWNHHLAGAEKLAEEVGPNASAFKECEEAVKDADVIVTATSSKVPILKKEWVKEGAHINAVGAPRPDWAELEAELVRSAVVYVDSREGASTESGDIILSGASIFAEIGEVINGTAEAKQTDTTIFKSLGMAIEDGIAAKIVMDCLGL